MSNRHPESRTPEKAATEALTSLEKRRKADSGHGGQTTADKTASAHERELLKAARLITATAGHHRTAWIEMSTELDGAGWPATSDTTRTFHSDTDLDKIGKVVTRVTDLFDKREKSRDLAQAVADAVTAWAKHTMASVEQVEYVAEANSATCGTNQAGRPGAMHGCEGVICTDPDCQPWGADCNAHPSHLDLCPSCYQRERRWRVAHGYPPITRAMVDSRDFLKLIDQRGEVV